MSLTISLHWHFAPLLCVCMLTWQRAASVSGDILLPPVTEGRDTGVAILAGADMLPQQYLAIGEELQGASGLRLWVHLSQISAGPVFHTGAGAMQANETHIGRARAALLEAGLPPDAPFAAIGHSLGGTIVSAELGNFPELADACVLWAAYVTSPTLEEFPVPALTMTGDLDAQTRITRIAWEFENLQELVESSAPDFKYRYPVAFVKGVNHAQYATGDMPARVVEYNIVPELTDEDARAQIIDLTDTFVEYWAGDGQPSKKTESEMDQWYEDTRITAEPILEVQRWEEDSVLESSYWVEEAQRYIAAVPEEYQDQLLISNQVVTKDDLSGTRASLEVDAEGNVHINTTTSVFRPRDDYIAAFMLESKMKSHESVMEALGIVDDVTDPPPITCMHVNDFAFQRVWELMSEHQHSRYLNSGVDVVLEEDFEQFWGPGWVAAELVYEHCNQTLTVQATSLWTSIDGESDTSGSHYCKMISPARAMEFMIVDSLRENPPTCIE